MRMAKGLGKISLKEALETTAMPGLILAHLMDGIVNSIEIELLGKGSKLFFTRAGAMLRSGAHLNVLLGVSPDNLAEQFGKLGGMLRLFQRMKASAISG